MKINLKSLLFIALLLAFSSVFAQYGSGYNGNGYGNGNGGYGSNRGMSHMDTGSQPEKLNEIPVEEKVSSIMKGMKPALNLDELQTIAISNVITQSINTQGRILKQDTTQEEQMKDFKILSESTDRKISELLSVDQKEKYLLYKQEMKSPKKNKSKEKNK